jgi:antitoxin YefM
MSTMPLSDVKARLSEIADEVDRTHERVHITRNGREYVVLMSAEDLESIEATLELLSDPRAMAEIREAGADVAAGNSFSGAEMAALMEERRRREGRGA